MHVDVSASSAARADERLAELVVDSAATTDTDQLAQAVSDLCLVLSVMRGTKVQWIYRQDWRGQRVIKTIHRAGLTKAYSPLAPLGYDYGSRSDSDRFVQAGIVSLGTSPILQADRTVIDAYLDAKVEHDFLETRAAKVALALEKLKQVCLQTGAMAVGNSRSTRPSSEALFLRWCPRRCHWRSVVGFVRMSVVVPGRYGGTMKNGGAPLDAQFCHVYRFHGDKVVMFQQYTDTAQWARLIA